MVVRNPKPILIRSVKAWYPKIEELKNPIIAGGFIRSFYSGETPRDMDLYFRDQEDFEIAVEHLKGTCELAVKTPRAITFKYGEKTIQAINFVFGQPGEIIEKFDFTVCSCCLSYFNQLNKWEEVLHEQFFEHLASRVLVYTGSDFPLSSLKRAVKYVKRGFHICDENLIALAENISTTIDFENSELVQTHIEGMDPEGDRRIRIID